jgi:uncharacterized protein (TIGR02466 family)
MHALFSNFLVVEDLDLDNKLIETYCLENLSQYPSINGDNQSYIISKEFGFNYVRPEIQPLLNIINEKFEELHEYLGFSDTYYQEMVDAWINYNECHNTMTPHYHTGKFFSAVYYVKANSNSGNINFVSSDAPKHFTITNNSTMVKHFNQFNTTSQWVTPETGRLVIFPAWLNHYVDPRKDTTDRISIAINSSLILK